MPSFLSKLQSEVLAETFWDCFPSDLLRGSVGGGGTLTTRRIVTFTQLGVKPEISNLIMAAERAKTHSLPGNFRKLTASRWLSYKNKDEIESPARLTARGARLRQRASNWLACPRAKTPIPQLLWPRQRFCQCAGRGH